MGWGCALNDADVTWPSRRLLEAASETGRRLPVGQAERLGRALRGVATAEAGEGLVHLVPTPGFAAAVEGLMAAWRECPGPTGECVGAAIAAAAHTAEQARRAEEIELVVSGPRSVHLHPRNTEQVLLELIGQAQSELLMITYALQGYHELRDALQTGVRRGVRITVLAETADDDPGFHGDPDDALSGLAVERLRWPREQRPRRGAALHAKVVVVDRGTVFITSANLTERASGDNLEAGVVMRGGDTGQRIAEHVDQLRSAGVLRQA